MLRFFTAVLLYLSPGAVSAGLVSKFVDGPMAEQGNESVKAAVNAATKAVKSTVRVGLAAQNAVENNFRHHSLELRFVRQNIVNDESLSDEEKRQCLAEVDELAQQIVLAGGKGAALGLAGTVAVAAAPAFNTAGLATSAYLMTNPTSIKVALLAQKTTIGLGTGILMYDYSKTAVNRGFGTAFARMQEDVGQILSVPTGIFTNAAKSAFSSVPKEVTAAKTLTQKTQVIAEEATKTVTKTGQPKKLPKRAPKIEDLPKSLQPKAKELEYQIEMYSEGRKHTKGFNHALEGHEFPSAKAKKHAGLPKKSGAVVYVQPSVHQETRTHGGKGKIIPADANIRDEFAKDIMDVRRILQKHGAFDAEVNEVMIETVEKVIEEHPEIYAKWAKDEGK